MKPTKGHDVTGKGAGTDLEQQKWNIVLWRPEASGFLHKESSKCKGPGAGTSS